MRSLWSLFILLSLPCLSWALHGPDELAELLPEDLLDFYGTLTREQERIMDAAMNGNDGDEDGFLGYIAKRDPELGQRAVHVFKGFIDKLSALKPTAQQFYLTLFNGLLRNLTSDANEKQLKAFTNEILLQWIGLKRSSRKNLATHFPTVAHVLNSQKLREYAELNF
ncbi:Fatty-acid and retinol-binding protein 3 [Aphelenchoides besseyi]|nr:Fatty-acid and retinol-binding protein 3 [Aphelenchoides besseyi]